MVLTSLEKTLPSPFNKVVKFKKKRNAHRTPLHAQRYLCIHFVTHEIKIS